MKIKAVIGLGSNLGDGRTNLLAAWQRLGSVPGVNLVGLSSPYLTAPVGMASPRWFTNAVGVVETDLEPVDLLGVMFGIEVDLGRVRNNAVNDLPVDRTLDLDLLYYGDQVRGEPGLILPHPEIAKRLFVLVPLAELAPEQRHPVLGLTSVEMLDLLGTGGEELADQQSVRKKSWHD